MTYCLFSIFWIIGSVPFILFSVFCLLKEMKLLQNCEYDGRRFFAVAKSRIIWLNLLGLLAFVPLLIGGSVAEIVGLVLWVMIYGAFFISREKNGSISGIVFNNRATRLYAVSLVIYFLVALALLFLIVANPSVMGAVRGVALAVMSLLPPAAFCFVWLSNRLMSPLEGKKDTKAKDDAVASLESYPDLFRVAVAGSYGKSSVVEILDSVLGEKYYTLASKGALTTQVAVSRLIREHLEPVHQVLIAEVDGRHEGAVAEVTEVISPDYAVITSLKPENSQNRPCDIFELADSMSDADTVVLNFNDPQVKANAGRVKGTLVTYGLEGDGADYWAEDIAVRADGTCFVLKAADGTSMEINTVLLGKNNVLNILGAVALGKQLGLSYKQMKRGLAMVRPLDSRMELRDDNGITILDDSKPSGIAGAMDMLGVVSAITADKKYLVVGECPAAVDGIQHGSETDKKENDINKDKENNQDKPEDNNKGNQCGGFLTEAKAVFDKIYITASAPGAVVDKVEAKDDGFKGDPKLFAGEAEIIPVAGVLEANEHIRVIVKKGDLVVYENDFNPENKGRKGRK